MPEKIPLSVALITKNEGENLREFLKSVEFASQIVVVDSGSTDDTVHVASQFGCDVFIEPWRGFGPQKQSAIDKCWYPWVLVLDADERIPAEKTSVIKNIILNPSNTAEGYMTLNTADQSQGFLFADTIGLGLNVSISRGSAIDINYRFRHLSNAGIREPNYGIEHHIGLISCSLFY